MATLHLPALGEVLTVLAQDLQVTLLSGTPPLLSCVVQSSNRELHPRCKRVTSARKKGDDPKTDHTSKGVDSNLLGWQPKEKRPNCRTTAGPTAKTTPPLSDAQKPWTGHPWSDGSAGYLPSGTVDQWYTVLWQWRNERRGGDPKTDPVAQGVTQNSPAGNPKRSQEKEVLSNQRGRHGPKTPVSMERGPKNPGVAAPLAVAGGRGNRLLDAFCVALLDRPVEDIFH